LLQMLAQQGRLEELRVGWKEVLSSEPASHEAWSGYAELCLLLGNEDEYRRNRTALLKRFGKTTDPVVAERTARACLLLPASGTELEQAVALADRAVTLGKGHQYYGFFMAAKALAEYRLGRFESALDWGQKAGARGAWVPTHLVLAMAHQQLGHADEACRSLDEAAKTYDWKGSDGIIHALWREAVAGCRKAIERDPKDASAYYNLGAVLHHQGKLDEAVAEFRKAIELEPNFAPAHNGLGKVLDIQKKLDEAVAEFRKAIELDPKYASAHGNLGCLLCDQGKLDEAVAEFQQLLRLQPDSVQTLNNLAWGLATAAERKGRDGRKAVALARLAVKAAPADGNSWNTLGAAHYSAGNWKEAVAALEKSMELRKGGNSFDWFFLAIAHWQLGEKDRARTWFGQAAEWMDRNEPNNEELRRFRAEAAELMGIDGTKK
jgi:tetratricopeptide (TPR) repeat protein